MPSEATATEPRLAPLPPARPPRRTFHGGWAMMIAAGLLAAIANLIVLGGGDGGVEVLVIDGLALPGTPAGQLVTRVDTMPIDNAHAWGLVGPGELGGMGGMVTAGTMSPGDLLRTSDLRQPSNRDGAAMSIPIDAARAVGGAIAAGDTVSVIAEVDGEVAVVIGAATVLAVSVPGTALGSPTGGHSITLQVTEDQALALSTALRTSELDIVRTGTVG